MYVVERGEFSVNEVEPGSQGQGEAVALDNGNFAVVFWEQTNVGNPKILVRVFDNAGQPIISTGPVGHAITVSTWAGSGSGGNNNNYIDQPVIAPVVGGGFIVAWTERVVVNGSPSTEVRAQTFNSAGVAVGELVTIPRASDPHISVSHAGHVLVYRTSVEGDNSDPDTSPADNVPAIMAMTLGTNASVLGTTEITRGVLLAGGSGTNSFFDVTAVAAVGTGHVVAWQSYENHTESSFDVVSRVQAFTGQGSAGPAVTLGYRVEDVAATGNGNFVVVGTFENSQTGGQDVVAQIFFGSTGQPTGSPFLVPTHVEGEQNVPAVSTIPGGGFVVAWHDQWEAAVGVQAFDALGQRVGVETPVSFDVGDDFAYDWSSPDVAVDANGDFLVTWTGYDASGFGVRGQLYSSPNQLLLYSEGDDVVDFGVLLPAQKEAIDHATATNQLDNIYNALGGNDRITLPDISEIQLTPGSTWNFAQTVLAGDGNDIVIGGNGDDRIDGGAGNDRLAGNGGNDTLTGGAGFDVADYFAATAGVTVNLTLGGAQATGGAGSDTLSGIEDILGSNYNDVLTGDDFGNFFFGNGGADILVGGGGNDRLSGGAGDDQLDGGVGSDTASYADASGAVTVSLAKSGAQVTGGAGTDVLVGFENLAGSGFDDILTGDASANVIGGGGGNDTIDGGTGADQLAGGVGNDIFLVDDAGDIVSENAGMGTDEVRTALTYILTANVENLRLTGAAAAGGTGNALDNTIRGNDAANSLIGLGGIDRLYGNGGDDTLEGGAGDDYLYGLVGNDTLNGGSGYDRMYGGVGDDTYIVNDIDDYAYEVSGEGHDRVLSSIDHQLRVEVEDLTLTGTAVIGKGNAAANLIVGNAAANKLYGYVGDDALTGNDGDDVLLGAEGNDTLTGGAGYDRMYGGVGDDRYIVGDLSDYAYENAGEGNDRVIATINHQLRANIEALELAGTADLRGYGNALGNLMLGNAGANLLYGKDGDDSLFGNAGADILYGENGADTLNGGSGLDRFYGGSGADLFAFATGDFAGMGSGTADRIHDFAQVQGDRIGLSAVDANSAIAGDQAFAFIGSGAFTGVAGQLRYQQISGNTYVQGDTNGDGTADFWVRMDGLYTLNVGDFLL